MRVLTVLAATGAALALAAVLSLGSCGKSNLSKAYQAYEARVEPMLDREIPTWKRVATLLNEQSNEETANFERFETAVRTEGVPFYDEFMADVQGLDPAEPGLVAAHAELLAYAKARREFVHLIADSLDVLKKAETTRLRDQRDVALRSAMESYGATLASPTDPPDTRFSELIVMATDFQNSCLEPLSEGRISGADVKERLETKTLPRIRSLRSTKFGEDEPSRLLREALAAAEEFFKAIVDDLPRMEAGARLRKSTGKLVEEGDSRLKKFREALAAVRRQL